jgi:hypothetical protein
VLLGPLGEFGFVDMAAAHHVTAELLQIVLCSFPASKGEFRNNPITNLVRVSCQSPSPASEGRPGRVDKVYKSTASSGAFTLLE